MIDAEKYPEHAKLDEVKHLSQAIYDFLEWCDKKGWQLMEYHKSFDGQAGYPIRASRRDLLAEHFEIDQKRLEDEKRAMLDAIRAADDGA